MKRNKRSSLRLAFVALMLGTVGLNAQTPDFEEDVLPILKNRCFECHGAPRKDKRGRMKFAKAGLRLDGKDHIIAGAVIVPRSPQTSMLVEYISLPAGDPDIMPPKGSPLTAKEVQTIYSWVNDGASYGSWVGESRTKVKKTAAKKVASASKSVQILKRLGANLSPLQESTMAGILPGLAQVEAVFPGSGLLRVSFARTSKVVDDDVLRKLAAFAPRIARLDLSGTKVTDKGLLHLTKMKRLVHLDLHKTGVTDAGLGYLKGLKELRSLNLYGTQVTDQGLPQISMLKKLNSLYLWRSQATAAGVRRLRQVLPLAKISFELVLPEPAPPEENPRRRRRGKK